MAPERMGTGTGMTSTPVEPEPEPEVVPSGDPGMDPLAPDEAPDAPIPEADPTS
jgi:hypothetical protein